MSKGFRITLKFSASEVTGSKEMIKIKRPGEPFERLVIDDGGFSESPYEILNYVEDVEATEISNVLVTHSHSDHILRLPVLVKNGYNNPIFCTPKCKKSIIISLEDSLKIMQSDLDKYGKPMLFTQNDLERTIPLLTGIEYNLPTHISKGVKVTFLGNGHLFGAACILLQITCKKYKDKNILLTGDYYPTNDLFDVLPIPEWVKKLNELNIVMESTYGNTSISDIKENLDIYILDEITKGQNILFPVISQERLELVLLHLKKLQDKSCLSKSVKIFIHTELGKRYLNEVYLKSPDIINFMPKNCELIAKGDFETILSHTGQKIVLASSGMAEKGPVRFYLKEVLPRKDFTLIFTCYLPKSTLAYRIKNSTKGEFLKVDNKMVPVYCSVRNTNELSRHVKKEQIVEFLSQFENIKNIFLYHGEMKTKRALFDKLKSLFPDANIFITNRETGFKIDPNIDVSAYPTDFISPEEAEIKLRDYLHKNKTDISNKKKKKKRPIKRRF